MLDVGCPRIQSPCFALAWACRAARPWGCRAPVAARPYAPPLSGPAPYWNYLARTNQTHPQALPEAPISRAHAPEPTSIAPTASDAVNPAHRSSAPRLGDVSPVTPTAIPPVVMVQTTERPLPRPGMLDITA